MTPKYPNVHVRLTGEDGNAFMVLGLCQRAARRAGLSELVIKEFNVQATGGDYNHLLSTAMEWFTID